MGLPADAYSLADRQTAENFYLWWFLFIEKEVIVSRIEVQIVPWLQISNYQRRYSL
jgi:hypothetical protein